MALNTYRHYELYFAAPSVGAVAHMVNIRLPLEQIAYILNHAEDRILFIENVFAGMIPLIRQHAPQIATIVVLGPVPGGLPPGAIDYEAFIAGHPTDVCVSRDRRTAGQRHVLHQRHHRRTEGRPLQPPRHRPAQPRQPEYGPARRELAGD